MGAEAANTLGGLNTVSNCMSSLNWPAPLDSIYGGNKSFISCPDRARNTFSCTSQELKQDESHALRGPLCKGNLSGSVFWVNTAGPSVKGKNQKSAFETNPALLSKYKQRKKTTEATALTELTGSLV